MARKEAAPRKEPELKKPEQPEIPDGYEEVGDHWEEMYAFESEGDSISGIYRGSAGMVGKNKSNVHILETDKVRVGVWGSTILDKRMEAVRRNADVRIDFIGMETSAKTGNIYRDFKVYQKVGTGIQRSHKEDDIPF